MPRSGEFPSGLRLASATASMRPGQSCPGVGLSRADRIRRCCGFNEAGAIMPRSGIASITSTVPVAQCFNEAGAIMPRSGLGRAARLPDAMPRFNEAGAIMPRSGLDAIAKDVSKIRLQ